jgi:hypothetical protein
MPTISRAQRLLAAFLLPFLVMHLASAAFAGSDIRTERVQFERGANSAVIEGSITGYETVDYLLRASKGQYLNVSMATDNGGNYFNILLPGETEVAMFNGSTADNQHEGVLPASGDYRLRLYLMRAGARRGETANYRLEVIIDAAEAPSKSSTVGKEAPSSAERAGQGDFDATGRVPCAQYKAQPMGQCDMGVAREGGGSATVVVTHADGRKRAIFFTDGKAAGADTSQADGNAEFRATREGDLNLIRVGDERYEIPDAAVFGG